MTLTPDDQRPWLDRRANVSNGIALGAALLLMNDWLFIPDWIRGWMSLIALALLIRDIIVTWRRD
jgi:hypothetical protein